MIVGDWNRSLRNLRLIANGVPPYPPADYDAEERRTKDDDLQAAQIELMHSISRVAVATFAATLIIRLNEAQLHEFATLVADALHDYTNTGR